MPDIASALQKALNEWEPTDPMPTPTPPPAKPYFSVTNNVTRVTFDYVRDNPGKTRIEVAKALEKQGFKNSSVTSLLGQMLKQGMMRESAHLLYTTTNEYTPIKSSKKLKAMAAKPQEQQRKKVVLINKRTGEVVGAAPKVEPTPVAKEWTPDDVIDKLTVHQAIALFKALRNVLVG
jgi:predicted SPOUT superfamily RNA methylase MTH1